MKKYINYNSEYEYFVYTEADDNNKCSKLRQATHKEIYESIHKLNDILYFDNN